MSVLGRLCTCYFGEGREEVRPFAPSRTDPPPLHLFKFPLRLSLAVVYRSIVAPVVIVMLSSSAALSLPLTLFAASLVFTQSQSLARARLRLFPLLLVAV